MKGRFKYEKLSKYPHLRPEDIEIWERFIFKYPYFFESVDYDVRVGEGQKYSKSAPENIREDLRGLTQKRIDVVGYVGNTTHIVEVKPRAATTAIGQVLTYEELYKIDFPEETNIIKTIITDHEVPDIATIVEKYNINIFVV